MDLEIVGVQRRRMLGACLGHRRLGMLAAAMVAAVAVLAVGLALWRPVLFGPRSAATAVNHSLTSV